MKLREIDWQDFFRRLEVWERLSRLSRVGFAKVQPSQSQPLSKFAGDKDLLIQSGFMTLDRSGRLRLHNDCRAFAAAIRFMTNTNLLQNPAQAAMHKYVTYQLDLEEREALCESMGLPSWDVRQLDHAPTSVLWLEKFLADGKELKPRQRRDPEWRRAPSWISYSRPEPKPVPQPPAVPLKTIKDLIRRFMAWPEPVPIRDLPARLPSYSAETLAAAVAAATGRLLLFAGVRHEDMMPMLGLWPAVSQRLHRPRLSAPPAVEPQTTFHGAVLMEDMTTLLVAASTRPIRVRRHDLAIFAKAEHELEAGLMSLPEWVAAAATVTPSSRIKTAARWLRDMKLLRRRSGSENPRLEPTRQAPDWLAKTARDRLQAVCDHLRRDLAASSGKAGMAQPDACYDDDDDDDYYDYERSPGADFLPIELHLPGGKKATQDLYAAMVEAFNDTPDRKFLPLDSFIAWRSQEHNPLPKCFADTGGRRLSSYYGYSARRPTAENLEAQWAQILTRFFRLRLLPLGGVRLGTDAQGDICFSLTSAGRYLLGLAGDFDYGHQCDSQAQVVVQPNFDVVFLAPSPLAEAAIARIAERHGRGAGAVFKITKKSILGAAGGGMTAQQTLDVLRRVSSKALPANVAREVQGWFDQCRQIAVTQAVLIRCPDAATAARVVAASGKRASAITETLVELEDASARTELVRKLHGMGIFVDRRHAGPGRRHVRKS